MPLFGFIDWSFFNLSGNVTLLNIDAWGLIVVVILTFIVTLRYFVGMLIHRNASELKVSTKFILLASTALFIGVIFLVAPYAIDFMNYVAGTNTGTEVIIGNIGDVLPMIPYWIIFCIGIIIIGIPARLILKSARPIFMWIFIPFVEEFFYRVFMINFFVSVGFSILGALLFSSLLFAYAFYHWIPRDLKNWNNYLSPALIPITGIVWGIIALNYGVLMAIISHGLHNMIGSTIGKAIQGKEKEGSE